MSGATTSKTDISQFHYEDYRNLFPANVAEMLELSLREKRRGWRRQAGLLRDIERYRQMCTARTESLIKTCYRKSAKLTERDHGRKYLEGLTTEQIYKACELYQISVNITSRTEMIEAILDSMEASE